MSVINQIQIDGVTYDIEDANTKQAVEDLEDEVEAATDEDILSALYS